LRSQKKLAMGGGAKADFATGVRTVGEVKLLARAVAGIDLQGPAQPRRRRQEQLGSGVVAIVGSHRPARRASVVGVTRSDARFSARRSGRKGAEALGGKGGGGRPDMAQAGRP